MIRRHLFALLLLAAMASALFAPALAKSEVFTFRDHVDYFQPLRWFTAMELREGRLPLWNPYSAAGEPWLANPQTGVFYPPSWLFLVLPFATAYMLYLLLHLVLLGWGSYFLFARDLSREAALVGAAALMLGGPALSMLDISNNLATFAWIPLVLVAARAQSAAGGGVALALAFLAGEPFFAAVGALLFVIVARRVWTIALAAVVAIGLSAVQLLPFVEMLAGSDRAAGLDAKQVLRDSMPLGQWLRLAIPPPLGELDPALVQHFIPVVYVGALVALLALAGLVAAARKRRAFLAWVVLIGLAIVIAAGPSFLVELPLTLFRYPARLIALGALGIAALAALGWDAIRPQKRWADLLLVLVIAADLLAHAEPLLGTAPFSTKLPWQREVGGDSMFLRLGEFDGNRRGWISGYLNLYERRFDSYSAAPVLSADYHRLYTQLLVKPSMFLLDAMAIGHVLTTRNLAPPFSAGARHESVRVWARSAPLLASAEYAARPAPSREAALASLLAGGKEWTVAGPGLPLLPGGVRSVPAKVVMTTSRATVTVETSAPAVVVLRQRDARGWNVTVNGLRSEGTLSAGGLFRAVAVGAGRHVIVWHYAPRSIFFGAVLTFITLLALVYRIFVKHREAEKF